MAPEALVWQGCYDGNWNGLIVPEAFAHPAKFANGLIRRIIEHGLARGYWRAGDTLGDPFGGVALGGIIAGYYGLSWRGVELEERFVTLGNQNLDLHRAKWAALGYNVDVRLVQGDSRHFAEIEIVGQAGGCVTSPPFTVDQPCPSQSKFTYYGQMKSPMKQDNGMVSPGNIQNLPTGELSACITSPPYAESIKGDHFERETAAETTEKRNTPGGSLGQSQRHGGYGATAGNIGNLKEGSLAGAVTSPPYDENTKHDHTHDQRDDRRGHRQGRGCHRGSENYGQTSGQIGNLSGGSVEAVVTSPGYGGSEHVKASAGICEQARKGRTSGNDDGGYQSDGNVSGMTGETYWQAMRAVYEQVRLALKPGGVMACVVKSYVSKGKIVDLPGDTLKLLVSLGFERLEEVHASLVKETTESTLFEGEVTKTKSRKSFFRRLCEAKGAPKIDYEVILFVQKSVDLRGTMDTIHE